MVFYLTLVQLHKDLIVIYISIVSHGHYGFIKDNINLLKINSLSYVRVVIRDNLNDELLKSYCAVNNIKYLSDERVLGFGANNNEIFKNVRESNVLTEKDYFILINPDVYIDLIEFEKLALELKRNSYDFCTINLFKDSSHKNEDPFVRRFPSIIDFLSSFLFSVNHTIYKRSDDLRLFDWCAGSFMCFSISSYNKLKGFDEGYFMYCEDIDICFRAKNSDINKNYLHNIKATHLAQHTNRKILSKHFFWHIKSIFRFMLLKNTPKFSDFLGLVFNSRLK